MKIAVSYEDGNIFQHFGHSKMFKIYEIDGQNIVDTKIIEAQGSGHSALATMLDDINVDALICGGIGNGAMEALVQMGIEVCSGVSGDADEAVAVYLNGSLESQGVNCDHHNNGEEHSCGHCGSDEEDCGCGSCGDDDGHGCGGCSGCGGSYTPPFDGPNVGKTCKVHYKGTFNDGTQFDSSYDRGEPLEFVCGAGMMILGFDKAVVALCQLVLQHGHVFDADAVKIVPLERDVDGAGKGFLRCCKVQKRQLKLNRAVEVVEEITPALEDRCFVLVL